ncbi:DUF4870 domain-containing protein [Solimonas soli]|uniref:DUF4870 domain-containing protein n=1 Tax=Solimonas soli TaxID=413479 RepID=UPI00048416E5|nr:DUF4870 domain-containing protein [Solimonas soli]
MNTDVSTAPSKDDCNLAMLAHLLGIFTGFIGALIIWILKKDSPSGFVAGEAKEALNFQITLLIGWVIAGILSAALIGMLLFPILLIGNIVLCILGALAAARGTPHRYPFTIRLLQ